MRSDQYIVTDGDIAVDIAIQPEEDIRADLFVWDAQNGARRHATPLGDAEYDGAAKSVLCGVTTVAMLGRKTVGTVVDLAVYKNPPSPPAQAVCTEGGLFWFFDLSDLCANLCVFLLKMKIIICKYDMRMGERSE